MTTFSSNDVPETLKKCNDDEVKELLEATEEEIKERANELSSKEWFWMSQTQDWTMAQIGINARLGEFANTWGAFVRALPSGQLSLAAVETAMQNILKDSHLPSSLEGQIKSLPQTLVEANTPIDKVNALISLTAAAADILDQERKTILDEIQDKCDKQRESVVKGYGEVNSQLEPLFNLVNSTLQTALCLVRDKRDMLESKKEEFSSSTDGMRLSELDQQITLLDSKLDINNQNRKTLQESLTKWEQEFLARIDEANDAKSLMLGDTYASVEEKLHETIAKLEALSAELQKVDLN